MPYVVEFVVHDWSTTKIQISRASVPFEVLLALCFFLLFSRHYVCASICMIFRFFFFFFFFALTTLHFHGLIVLLVLQEDISGLSTAQTLELCDPEVLLFQEPLQNSEVTSTSNCCHEDTSHFFKTTYKNGTEITAATDGCSLPELIFDNDIYVSKDFALSSFIPPIFPNNYQEDQLSLLDQSQSFSQEAAVVNGLPAYPPDDHFAPIAGPTIMPSLLGERCLSLMPNPYMRLTSFLGSANTVLGPYLPCNLSSTAVLSDDKYSGIFNGSTDYVGTRVQNQDLKVLQGDHNGGIFSSDPLPGIYGSSGPLPGNYDSSTVLQVFLLQFLFLVQNEIR